MVLVEKEQFKGKGISENKIVVNKQFKNCQFERCNLSQYLFTNCEFEDCVFTNCNFKRTAMALNKMYDSGKFINCAFIACNLTAASFNFPVIDNCEFRNCTLKETNFDGSRFSATRFIGELDSCFFRGYSIFSTKGTLFAFTKFDPLKVPNNMLQVDFSKAKMVGVSFTNRINLSSCIFPEGPDYVYIPDLKSTMISVKAEIEKKWTDSKEKNTAFKLIGQVYYNKDMQQQADSFMDAYILREGDQQDGTDLGQRVFDLIKTAAS